MRRQTRRGQRGQAMVECAIILVMTLAVLIGAMDFGQVMYYHQSLAARAQLGAHWAAVNPYNAASVANMVVYGNPAPTAGNQALISGLTTAMVSSSVSGVNTNNAMVQVQIQNFPYRFYSPWIAHAYTARPITVRLTHEPSLP